jgi:mono/diheme cytochrome c family protein
VFARMLILVLALAAVVRADAAPARQADTTRNPLAADAAAAAAGGASYERTCLSCHGPAGQGDRGPALNTGRFTHGSEDGDLFHAIRAGITGTQMPAFARLSDTEVWQLVSYLRSLTVPASSTPPVAIAVTTRDGRELRGTRLSEDTFTIQFADAAGNWY